MEPKTFQEAAHLVAREFAELVIGKQIDYGPRNITDFGEYGILVRLNDKLQRLINLSRENRQPKNEAIDDTWDDIGGYAFIRKMMQRGWFELPMGAMPCLKCGHEMEKTNTYVGESSNIYPIGQIYRCDLCGETIGITSDGRITNHLGEARADLDELPDVIFEPAPKPLGGDRPKRPKAEEYPNV